MRRYLGILTLTCMALLAGAAQASAAGSISGTVTDAVTEAPIEEVEVCWWKHSAESEIEDFGCLETDEDGKYAFAGLVAGEYGVEFWAPYLGYLPQFYDGRSFFENPDVIEVTDEPVTGIDAALAKGARIEGAVSDASNGAPIEEAEVCAYELEIEFFRCAFSDAAGGYSIGPLEPGSYTVEFWAPPYETQFYNGRAEFGQADQVSVTPPETVTGIDAQMSMPPLVPALTPPVTPPAPPPVVIHRKRKKCRKGFRRRRVHGKRRCVRIKKHRRRHHPRPR